MKLINSLRFGWMTKGLLLVCALSATATTLKANVYATDVKVDGTLTNGAVASPQNGAVGISYILNEAATAGVTVNILTNGNVVVDTINIASPNAGTLRGLNTVVWGTTNSAG